MLLGCPDEVAIPCSPQAYLGVGIPHIFRAKSNLGTGKEIPETGGSGIPKEGTVFKTKSDVSDYSTELAWSATIVAYRKSPASSVAMADKPRGTQSTSSSQSGIKSFLETPADLYPTSRDPWGNVQVQSMQGFGSTTLGSINRG